MKYRQFGNTGLEVSEIGFGCARLGGFFQNVARDEAVLSLNMAREAGINFFDTSDMYSQGESELLVGETFRQQRDAVIIASKGGYVIPTRRSTAIPLKSVIRKIVSALGIKRKHLPSGFSGALTQNFSPTYLRSAVEASLARLKTDYLDLYQLHSPPREIIEQGDAIGALEEMKAEGKIRYYGISCDRSEDIALCAKYPGLASVQVGVGLLDPEALAQAIPQAARNGVAIIARGCFGGGLLNPALVVDELKTTTTKWPTILRLRQIAEQNRRDILEMALHFVLSSDAVSVTLLGMRTREQLTKNLRHRSASCLSEKELEEIADLSTSVPSPTR